MIVNQNIKKISLGLCKYILHTLDLYDVNIYQTGNIAIWAVIIVMAWRTIGYVIVMILVRLKGSQHSIIEVVGKTASIVAVLSIKMQIPVARLAIADIGKIFIKNGVIF